MKKSIIITDICKFTGIFQSNNFEEFTNYSKIIFDIGLIALINKIPLNNLEKSSMISYYLGANTFSLKTKYFEYLCENKIKSFIYFFDLSSIKFEVLDKIKQEFEFIKDISKDVNVNIYIPTKIMSNYEIFNILNILNILDIKDITIGNLNHDSSYQLEDEFYRINKYAFNISIINEFPVNDFNYKKIINDKRVSEIITKL